MTDRIALPGSDRHEARPNGVSHPRCHPDERAEVTIRLSTGDEMAMRAVSAFAIANRLSPTHADLAQKVVKASGSIRNLESAFGVELLQRELPGGHGTFRSHYGPISVPAQLADVVSGVFGLDDRPVAKSRITPTEHVGYEHDLGTIWFDGGLPVAASLNRPDGSFLPADVGNLYKFPPSGGINQTIALIELGGGYKPADLRAYWQYVGIHGRTPNVVSVSVNGGRNAPGSDADSEVMLDIEVAGSIAPHSTIAVYFAGNSERDFLDAVSQAVHDDHLQVDVISISWGGPEVGWYPAGMQAMEAIMQQAAAKGITVLVASGDNGSDDGVGDGKAHVDFPASCPSALGCGGTRLSGNGSTITSEVAWNEIASGEGAGGGGCSTVFAAPSYQPVNVCSDKRAVPDVAGNADPTTGYVVRVDGQYTTVGGTSAVAPLYAGLIARLNQITGKRVGHLAPILYAHPEVCHDVVSGTNGAFNCSGGYDPVTGLGSINGTKLLDVLKA